MSEPVQLLLSRLENVRQVSEGQYTARCPAHDDEENSLSVGTGREGQALAHCFAGCTTPAIVDRIGLKMQDLYPAKTAVAIADRPLTLAELAADKAIPAEYLRKLGVKQVRAGVLIPYLLADGSRARRQRVRTALKAKDGSRWAGTKGESPVPYGLWMLDRFKGDFLVFVEGESDAWTLWHHGIPALGIPGADMAGKIEPGHVQAFRRIYVVQEPDQGGRTFVAGVVTRLQKIGWAGEVLVIQMPTTAKDPNELYKQDPSEFKDRFRALMDAAQPPSVSLAISPGDGQAFPVTDSKPQSDAPGHDYRAENGQMLIEVEKRNKKGEVYDVERKVISDFEARITEEVTDENGRRSYLIEGITFGERRRFSAEVDAATFEDDRQLKKVLGEAAGARASIRSGMSSHLAPAIKLNSTDVRRRLRYSRTGWAGDTFLVPGREREGVEIDLPNGLPYRVHAGDVEKGREALRAALRAVDPSLTTVLLAYLLTAPIARYIRLLKKYALFIKGRTGTWKTSVAQVFMCLYGADFIRDESILKFGQGATGNALLHIASHVHDMPLMWDNYKPNVGGGEREFISFTHAAVEGSEKARLNRNGELQPRRELRCWPVCTGEDLPSSDAAALARLLCVEFSASAAATNPHLDTAQSLSEHLPALGNALIEWLESEEGRDAAARANEAYPAQRAKVAEYLRGVRSDMANALRAASNIASNRLVYEVVMECPVFSDILKEHQAAHAAGLQVCADRIASYTADSSEALRLLSGIKSLLAAERVRFDDRGSYPMGTHTDNRVKIGYRDSAGYYLLLDVAIEEVEKLYRRSGGLSGMSNQTICSQLLELGFVASTSKTKTTKLIKVNGDPVRVLHLVHGAIDEPAEEA